VLRQFAQGHASVEWYKLKLKCGDNNWPPSGRDLPAMLQEVLKIVAATEYGQTFKTAALSALHGLEASYKWQMWVQFGPYGQDLPIFAPCAAARTKEKRKAGAPNPDSRRAVKDAAAVAGVSHSPWSYGVVYPRASH
jgi:hypothetical protein